MFELLIYFFGIEYIIDKIQSGREDKSDSGKIRLIFYMNGNNILNRNRIEIKSIYRIGEFRIIFGKYIRRFQIDKSDPILMIFQFPKIKFGSILIFIILIIFINKLSRD